MTAVGKIYDRLKIKFDSYAGESFYNDKMEACLDILREKHLLVESDGAQVVNLDAYDMPPCLLVKADGATLYATRDIAAAYYRKKHTTFTNAFTSSHISRIYTLSNCFRCLNLWILQVPAIWNT